MLNLLCHYPAVFIKIGTNAQCRLIKVISVGLKNEPTNYRTMELSQSSFDFINLSL